MQRPSIMLKSLAVLRKLQLHCDRSRIKGDVTSSTSIMAPTLAVTEGTTFYVTVTTPGGTGAHNSSAVFTYSAVAPNVTSISTGGSPTPGGSIAGGTAVQITGTGIFTGATVNFVEETGGRRHRTVNSCNLCGGDFREPQSRCRPP